MVEEERKMKRERKGLDGQRAKSWLVWSNIPQDSSIIVTDRVVYICIPAQCCFSSFLPTPDAILVLFCCEHPESGGSNSPKTYPMLNTAYFVTEETANR